MSESLRSNWLRDPWLMLAVGFGSGFAPRMPGTIASGIAGLVAWFLFCHLEPYVRISCVIVLILVSWFAIHKVLTKHQVGDAPQIVIDEMAGMWVAVALLPEKASVWLGAFLLFRVFDIWKPFPIGWIDRKLPGAWGILLDDVVAGLMALILANALSIWIVFP